MTRRQLFKNFGLGLAGMLTLPLFGKPGKVSEPKLQLPGNPAGRIWLDSGMPETITLGFTQLRAPSGELVPVMLSDDDTSGRWKIHGMEYIES